MGTKGLKTETVSCDGLDVCTFDKSFISSSVHLGDKFKGCIGRRVGLGKGDGRSSDDILGFGAGGDVIADVVCLDNGVLAIGIDFNDGTGSGHTF